MAVVHQPVSGDRTLLATDVTFADGLIRQGLGLMFSPPIASGEAMVFRFPDADVRHVHTWFVRATIDVVWVERERVTEVATLPPWSLGRRATADTVVELRAGAADGVAPGDVVRIQPASD